MYENSSDNITIRFYKYYFNGVEKPIIMEAPSRIVADKMLVRLKRESNVSLDFKKLIDIRVETPLFGISEKKRNGIDYLWVGLKHTKDGWIEKKQFEEIFESNK